MSEKLSASTMIALTEGVKGQTLFLGMIYFPVSVGVIAIFVSMHSNNITGPASILSFIVGFTISPLLPGIHKPYEFLHAAGLIEEAKLVQAIHGLAWFAFIILATVQIMWFLDYSRHVRDFSNYSSQEKRLNSLAFSAKAQNCGYRHFIVTMDM